ncbi:Transcription initiation factor TFIID subunit 5 [Boothiomyces sp. JEL0866]|nr:Transcription initiation factor TFIID subunit 5 [Boothiomyces sp. JEL0866]
MADQTTSDRIVANYLAKRGFKSAEHSFRQEARLKDAPEPVDDDSIANFVLFYNEEEANNPKAYEQSYARLVKWVDDSIDTYKLELKRILFPVFVHAYLDLVQKGSQEAASQFFEQYKGDHLETHANEIFCLSAINDPIHLQEDELCVNFRQNKYGIKMCKYSFELLLSFLQDNKFMMILRLMNQYITIHATNDKPGQLQESDSGTGLIGTDISLTAFNQQQVQLGPIQPDVAFYGDIERALATQIHSDGPELLEQVQKAIASQDSGPTLEDVPLPPKKLIDIQSEIEYLRDLRLRVNLNSNHLPSIVCYTFHNTENQLNCLKASKNAEFLAAGLSDSFIKLWNVVANRPEIPAPAPTSLIGHSGPIYGLDFSSDGKYLLSASEDKSGIEISNVVRLWSTETKSALVSYKGHNYPIFDVAFANQGFYFATASADKTARLWSLDHIFPLRLFVGHLSDVDYVKFHPNCNYVATASSDQTCRLWDIQKGNCVRIFPKHNGPVTAISISPDGKLLASAGGDNAIRLWDINSGQLLKKMFGHESTVTSLDFSQNSTLLASSSDDDTVRIWDAKKADTLPLSSSVAEKGEECIKSFTTKRTPVYNVGFTSRNVLVALGVFAK